MKIYLKYPWKFPDSSYYKSIISNPPNDVEYVNVKPEDFMGISSQNTFKNMFRLKTQLRKVLTTIKRPNLVIVNQKSIDVIHCAHCLNQSNRPWVVDTESYWNLSSTSDISYSKFGKAIIKSMLKSKFCKKILPWTATAKKEIIEAMNDKTIEEKIELLPYAIPLPNYFRTIKKELTFLFVGRYFMQKGGLTAIKVFDELIKRYPIKVIIVSPVPEEIKTQYDLFKNPNVEVHDLMTQEKLMKEIYPKASVFLYPGYSDSFGFMMVEAMSYGIPTITVDGYAKKDIIANDVTGIIIPRSIRGVPSEEEEKELVKELIEKASLLIEKPNLLKYLALNCIEEVRSGRFSIEKRNEKLKRIYEEAK